MNAVLVAAYFVMLVMTVVSVYVAVKLYRLRKVEAKDYIDRQKATKQWSQRLVQDTDAKVEEANAAVQLAGAEGFQAGRADMLNELKQRVDRGEVDVKIISTPVMPPVQGTPAIGVPLPTTPTTPVPPTRIPIQ